MIINAAGRFQSDVSLYPVLVPSVRNVGYVAQSSAAKSIPIRATAPGKYYAIVQTRRLRYSTYSGRSSIVSDSSENTTLTYDKESFAPENHTFSISVPKFSGSSTSYHYNYYVYITVWGPDKVTFIE